MRFLSSIHLYSDDTMNRSNLPYCIVAGIVTTGGHIRGCFDEVYEGITVGDLLREFLLNEDSENASTYTDSEKRELIFQVFRLLAIGGGMCQPDNDLNKCVSCCLTLV